MRKYYIHYKNTLRKEREEREGKEERRVGEGKEFERTLKIKRKEEATHSRTIRLAVGENL